MTGAVIPDLLFYIALPVVALILGVGWLIYASRGGRAVSLNFRGFGISVDIQSANQNTKPEGSSL